MLSENSASSASPSKYPSFPSPARVVTLFKSSDEKSFPKTAIPSPEDVKSTEISTATNFLLVIVAVNEVEVVTPSEATSPIVAPATAKVTAGSSLSLTSNVAALFTGLPSTNCISELASASGEVIVAIIVSVGSSTSDPEASSTPVTVIVALDEPAGIVTVPEPFPIVVV